MCCMYPQLRTYVFTEGNKETLMSLPSSRGQDVRKELLEFHSKHYSSNVMGLAVFGKGECIGRWESVQTTELYEPAIKTAHMYCV